MTDQKQKYGILENVTFAYVKVAEPSLKYQSTDTEYSVDAIVEKAVAKKWNKEFPKQKAKELDKDEFEKKYKIESPYDEDEVYVIKLKKPHTKNGKEFDEKYRPRLMIEDSKGVRTDVTVSRLCANGSKGKVSYRLMSNEFGTFAQLQNILIDEKDFIEYKSQSGSIGSEFGIAEVVVEAENESATKHRANKAVKQVDSKEDPEEEIDDTPPF